MIAPAQIRRAVVLALLLAGLAASSPSRPGIAGGATPIRIVAFGDSLVAGYGLRQQDAFPEQLQAALGKRTPGIEIINAGVSGDTSAAALARLDWAIPENVDGAIVLLGGNDFLRGLSPKKMQKNLDEILAKLRKRNLKILLLGMKAPRNAGKAYYTAFDRVFPTLAEKHGALLDPFFLEGVAQNLELNQIDGLHPNAKGVARIVTRLLPKAEALIERIRTQREVNGKS
ncbi:MAG: arylesterase [Hyphomicrobiaceae bacterium]